MIPKEERDKDKVICDAATQGRWIAVQPRSQEGGMCLLHAGPTWADEFPAATSIRLADQVMPVSWEQHAANAAFVVTAHKRLPVYIADAEEMEWRMREIERRANVLEGSAKNNAANGETDQQAFYAARADALRLALKILRGEK